MFSNWIWPRRFLFEIGRSAFGQLGDIENELGLLDEHRLVCSVAGLEHEAVRALIRSLCDVAVLPELALRVRLH